MESGAVDLWITLHHKSAARPNLTSFGERSCKGLLDASRWPLLVGHKAGEPQIAIAFWADALPDIRGLLADTG